MFHRFGLYRVNSLHSFISQTEIHTVPSLGVFETWVRLSYFGAFVNTQVNVRQSLRKNDTFRLFRKVLSATPLHNFCGLVHISEKIMPEVTVWQNRPLETVYPFVFLDAIHYKVKGNHQYQTKAAYVVLGITMDGTKDILGVWIGEHESSKFWLNVLNGLNVLDIHLFCVDGLKGFVEAIRAIYPHSQVQRIVHQIRSSTRYKDIWWNSLFQRFLKPFLTPSPSVPTGISSGLTLSGASGTGTAWQAFPSPLSRMLTANGVLNPAIASLGLTLKGSTQLPETPWLHFPKATAPSQAVDSLNAVYDVLYILRGEMLRLASLLPEFDVVIAMQGAGEVTGPQLMAEIGDVRRFTHKGALVAFAGMDAPPFQSGTLFMSSCSYSSGGKDAGGSSEIGGLGVTMIISGGWVTTITSGGVFSALICS